MSPDPQTDAPARGVSFEEMPAPGRDSSVPPGEKSAADLEAVFDVPVRISVVLGRTRIPVASLLKMDVGTIVELDRQVGEAIGGPVDQPIGVGVRVGCQGCAPLQRGAPTGHGRVGGHTAVIACQARASVV